MHRSRPLLLVEDDQVDARTVKRALVELNIQDSVVHMPNGEEALAYLRSSVNEHPCLILLDLNMPKMNGIEFLKEVKKDPSLRRIPIVVLTTSKEDRDVWGTFEHSVAGYMVKPIDYKKFVETIHTITKYWSLSVVPAGI
jgi:CheY-like chemotaxis protein